MTDAPNPPPSFAKLRPKLALHTLRGKLIIGLTPGLIALLILLGVSLKATDIMVAANRHLAEAGRELAITRAMQVSLGQIQLLLNEQSPLLPSVALFNRFQTQADLLDAQFAEASVQYGEQGEQKPFHQAMVRWRQAREEARRLLDPTASPLSDEDQRRIQTTLMATLHDTQNDLQALSDAVVTEMDITVMASQRAHDRSSFILITSTIVALLLGVLFMFWFARYLSTPLTTLTESARRLGRGDLDVRIAIHQQDEIGDLAREFNLMAEKLQRRSRELEGVSAERTAYAQELQEVLRRNVQIQEAERKRIADDIHDGVSQWLMGAMFEVQAARVRIPFDAPAARHLEAAQRVLKEVKEEMRRVIYDLHPPLLESNGLVTALRGLVQEQEAHFHIPIQLDVTGEPYRLSIDRELALFRIAQEALNNVHKHAQATTIQIHVQFEPEQITLVVTDDGRGFESSPSGRTPRRHLGLTSMRERAAAVGAKIIIQSQPGQGSEVKVCVPASLSLPMEAV